MKAMVDQVQEGGTPPAAGVSGPVTLADVARATGFSLMTVSNALRDKPKVSEANRARIKQVARSMGYQANVAATMLRNRRSGIIQIVVDDFEVPFHARVAKYLTQSALERGYQVVVRQSLQSQQEEMRALNPGPGLIYDGVILDAPNITESQVAQHNPGRPVLVIGDCESFVNVDSMDTACAQGAAAAAEHLVLAGCRRVVVLGAAHPDDQEAARASGNGFGPKRLAAIARVLEEHGLALERDQCIICVWTLEGGRQAAAELLNRVPGERWDGSLGVLCLADTIAMGALREFADHGIVVPRDAKIMGFDDIPFAEYSNPSISTVRMDVPAMAREVIDRMIRMIDANAGDGADDGVMHGHVPFQVVARDSTGA